MNVPNRDEVLALIRAQRADLEQHHVKSLALFGSVARGDAAASSDVDLLVEFSRPVGLFSLARLRRRLEEILGARVDLVPRNGQVMVDREDREAP